MKRGERRIVTNLTRTHPHSHAERVLTAQACDPEGAVHQRGQAQQHRLLSMSKTPHTCTKPLHIPSGAHGCIVTLSFLLSFSLSYAHTHTHGLLCLQKAGTNERLCVVCVLTQLPPGHTLPTQQKTALCVSLSLSLSPSISISLSILFSLSPYFLLSLENRVVLLCSAVYITYCIYFLGAWQQIYEHSSGCFFFFWLTPAIHISQ